jgi:hypothetical protein
MRLSDDEVTGLDIALTEALSAGRRYPVTSWRQAFEFALTLDPNACSISSDLHHHTDDFLALRRGW